MTEKICKMISSRVIGVYSVPGLAEQRKPHKCDQIEDTFSKMDISFQGCPFMVSCLISVSSLQNFRVSTLLLHVTFHKTRLQLPALKSFCNYCRVACFFEVEVSIIHLTFLFTDSRCQFDQHNVAPH